MVWTAGAGLKRREPAMSDESRRFLISKGMVRALRHGEDEDVVQLRTDGFASIGNLLKTEALMQLGATEADVLEIVAEQQRAGEKARYRYMESADGDKFVRAVQGHSRRVEQI